MRRWIQALPIVDTLRGYRRIDFAHDSVAGLVLGVVTVPQAVAYAFLAGLPAQAGLYACLAPMVIYSVLGSSRQLIVGPVAIAALMVAATVGEHAPAHSDAYIGITTILCMQVGILLWLLRLLGMGGIVNLLSHPVITGFVNAAAILIIISQLPAFTGIAIDRGDNAADRLTLLFSAIGNLDPVAVGIGIASLAGVWLVRRYAGLAMRDRDHPISRTGPMFVAIAGTATVAILGLGVDTVGFVPAGLPAFALPPFDPLLWLDLAPAAAMIALVTYIESFSIGTTLASRERSRIDASQELVALGAANVGAAFTGAYPVAGSFSKSSVNVAAGARTPVSALVCVVVIAATLLWMTPLFANLPHATLAAIIIVAIVGIIDFSMLREQWRFCRADVFVHFLALGGVLMLGVEAGLLLAVGTAIVQLVHRSSRPHIAVVGRLGDSGHFRNVTRYDTETSPNVAAVRLDENLYFANANQVEDRLLAIMDRHEEARHLVLVCSAINFIDTTGLEMLRRLNHTLALHDIALHLSELKGRLRDRLGSTGLPDELSGNLYITTDEAMRELAASPAPAVEDNP
ncbi:MAG: sulfate permease [Gammaproteobacteria bacterium]|nr:sulfate permease [Gammaproteobacteria bacterium]